MLDGFAELTISVLLEEVVPVLIEVSALLLVLALLEETFLITILTVPVLLEEGDGAVCATFFMNSFSKVSRNFNQFL